MNTKFNDQEICEKYISPKMRQLLLWSNINLDHKDDFIRVVELLKYLYLTSIYGGSFIPVSKEIDEMWHTFILQTTQYLKLCLSLPGKKFIHHETIPFAEYKKTQSSVEIKRNFFRWLPVYNFHFHGFTEENLKYWGLPYLLVTKYGYSLKDINDLKESY